MTDFNDDSDEKYSVIEVPAETTVNPDYQEQIDEQRRLVAIDMATRVSDNINDLIDNANKIVNWLVDNPVNAVKTGDGATNEFSLGGE